MEKEYIKGRTAGRSYLIGMTLAGLILSVILRSDWPGAEDRDISFVLPVWCYLLFEDIVYCVPVIFCLLTAIVADCFGSGEINRTQHRWLIAMTSISILAGMFPLYSINHFARYRLGVPGFLVPYVVVAGLFWMDMVWGGRKCNDSRFRRFLKLFLCVASCAVSVRAILYLVKL